jgi:hypothetical protein
MSRLTPDTSTPDASISFILPSIVTGVPILSIVNSDPTPTPLNDAKVATLPRITVIYREPDVCEKKVTVYRPYDA